MIFTIATFVTKTIVAFATLNPTIVNYIFIFFSFESHQPNDLRNSPKELKKFNETNRKFNGAKDVSRDFSNSQDNTDRGSISDQAFACSASSVESLPSASGSSKFG